MDSARLKGLLCHCFEEAVLGYGSESTASAKQWHIMPGSDGTILGGRRGARGLLSPKRPGFENLGYPGDVPISSQERKKAARL